jgi:rhodanese-related sulfurtransferase
LDVRTPKEVENGYIKTAMFVNYYDKDFFVKASQQLDKNKPVYLYCKSGNRSGKASKILQKKDYKVYNVIGGYSKWKTEN